MTLPDIVVAIKPVVKAFEALHIAYYIGGSVASSACGIARATMALFRNNVVLFKHFYVGNELQSTKLFLNNPYGCGYGRCH